MWVPGQWGASEVASVGIVRTERPDARNPPNLLLPRLQIDHGIASSGKEPVHRAFLDLTSPLE